MLRFLDDRVLDLPELFLLRQRWTYPLFLFGIIVLHLALKFPPCLIALIYDGQAHHLAYDLIHQFLHWLRQVAIGFLTADLTKLPRQVPNHLLRFWMVTGHLLHRF